MQYCMQNCDMKLRRKIGAAKRVSGRFLKKAGRAKKMATARASANGIGFADAGNSEVRRLSRAYHLSNEALSRVTGASPRTVAYWNAGTQPHRSSAQKIREVTRLFDALADIIDAKVIGQWLQRPNQQFDGSTPLQVMERGETDRLWRMIWQLREGHSG
jgi:DNA-binding transcriptional regulator YiaG